MLRTVSLLGLALGAVTPALAQDADERTAFDGHGLKPVVYDGDVRDPLLVYRPGTFHAKDFSFSILGEYAKAPLVQVTDSERGGSREDILLDDVYALNVSMGYALIDRLRIDAGIPLFLSTKGLDEAPNGFDVGDVRATVFVAILRPKHIVTGGGFGLGVLGFVDAPSGRGKHFLGRGMVAAGGKLAATYEYDDLTFTADAGVQINPTTNLGNLTGADAVLGGFGLGYRPHPTTGITAEIHLEAPWETNPHKGTGFPVEIALAVRHRQPIGIHFLGGVATALTQAAGAAQVRAFFGIGYGHQRPMLELAPDDDALATFQSRDGCPGEFETQNNWKDDDGCPDGLGTLEVSVKRDGALFPGAALTITGPEGKQTATSGTGPLAVTSMPNQQWSATAAVGCLEGQGNATTVEGPSELVVNLQPVIDSTLKFEVYDEPGNRIPNVSAKLMTDTQWCLPTPEMTVPTGGQGSVKLGAGTYRVFLTAPEFTLHEETLTFSRGETKTIKAVLKSTKVRLERERIVILDKVHFEYNKAVIKPESFGLLDEVASTILANPQVGRVEVAGHTDSDGSDKYNLDLSQRRAEAVRDYLVGRSVPSERLIPVGFGESQPIADNKVEDGKARNRRVEFNLIDQIDDPSKGGTP